MAHEITHQGYLISDDPALLDRGVIKDYLKRSYWAATRPEAVIDKGIDHSLSLGTYAPDGAMVGNLRLISDFATFGWLCDVFVLEAHRGKGLSKAALAHLHAHPRLQTIGRFMLGTADAHRLYAQFGYHALLAPQRVMEKRTAAFIAPVLPS